MRSRIAGSLSAALLLAAAPGRAEGPASAAGAAGGPEAAAPAPLPAAPSAAAPSAAAPSAAAPSAAAPEAAVQATSPGGGRLRSAAWIVGGAGAAAVVAGGIFGLVARHASNVISDAARAGGAFNPGVEERGQRAQTLEYACLGAGAAGLLGGGLLLLLAPPAAGARASVAPALVPGGAGATLALRY